jgi:hypothetical protein
MPECSDIHKLSIFNCQFSIPMGFVMKASVIRITLFGLVCLLLSSSHPAVAAEGNISDTEKYAWSENAGWLNFRPADGGVTVHDTYLSGYAWAENLGWVKLGHTPWGGGQYNNNAADDWGVNKDSSTGALSGYAWSENVGWIKFNPSHGQVTIDPTTLKFDGYAWAENVGWAHFQNVSPGYYVMQEAGAPTVTTQAVSAIGSTTATGNGNITDLGAPNPTAHGVCWNTGGTPTIADSHTDEGAANATGVFTTSMTGLLADTTYYVRAYATNTAGTAYGDQVSFTTSNDGTGVPSATQDAGPNGGDGNGDGILDSKQATVASLPSATGGGYLTVEISGCSQIEQVQAHTYESVGTSDPGYSYPFGLLGFEIPCASATVRIYYHGADSLAGFTYRKYGPTPDDWGISLWYTMPGATFGTGEIGEATVPYAEFVLTESQLGDDTNGSPIIDQGGPAQPGPTFIPTLNEWGMIILSLLMAVSAFVVILRRQQS